MDSHSLTAQADKCRETFLMCNIRPPKEKWRPRHTMQNKDDQTKLTKDCPRIPRSKIVKTISTMTLHIQLERY